MSNENIVENNNYHLLLIPEFTSHSKRFYKLFKPRDIVEFEGYEICFKITNIGNKSFPGGTIKNIRAVYPDGACLERHDEFSIPEIPSKNQINENTIKTKSAKGIAIKGGIAWIHLTITSKDSKEVKYYMFDRVFGEKNVKPVNKPEWEDCFQVASRHEIHQRYTNYILLILTIISTLMFLKNL